MIGGAGENLAQPKSEWRQSQESPLEPIKDDQTWLLHLSAKHIATKHIHYVIIINNKIFLYISALWGLRPSQRTWFNQSIKLVELKRQRKMICLKASFRNIFPAIIPIINLISVRRNGYQQQSYYLLKEISSIKDEKI